MAAAEARRSNAQVEDFARRFAQEPATSKIAIAIFFAVFTNGVTSKYSFEFVSLRAATLHWMR
jgi:hypothetical protein